MTETQAATSTWTAPDGPLGELTGAARARVRALAPLAGELERSLVGAVAPGFAAALYGTTVAVIAEVKRRSPSKGPLNAQLDASARAAEYEAGGAAALSILTEPTRFGGSLDDLRAARAAVSVPLLRKDFIVDRLQLLEARAAGASAVLLIARALSPATFAALADEAGDLGLELLLEVRSEGELERALLVERGVIGVNSRNLETLVIEEAVPEHLLPKVPAGRLAVCESGISDRAGVERAASYGADAVLVGSALSVSPDGRRAVGALVGVPRRARGR